MPPSRWLLAATLTAGLLATSAVLLPSGTGARADETAAPASSAPAPAAPGPAATVAPDGDKTPVVSDDSADPESAPGDPDAPSRSSDRPTRRPDAPEALPDGVLAVIWPAKDAAAIPVAPDPGVSLAPEAADASISLSWVSADPRLMPDAPHPDGHDATQVLHVPDEHATIAAAIAAAPTGAVIRIGPGTYRERLRIAKRLTLVGAGADETILEGTRGLDRILAIETSAAPVRLQGLTFRALAPEAADRPDGVVAVGARVEVRGCRFAGLDVALALDGAPRSRVIGVELVANDVGVRAGDGAPYILLSTFQGPGRIGIEAAASDALVAWNTFSGLQVAAAFGGRNAAPIFVSNTVRGDLRTGVFADEGTRLTVHGNIFDQVDAPVVVVDAVGLAGDNVFWRNSMGTYFRDPGHSGALFALEPPPGINDRVIDPMLDDDGRPRGGSPVLGSGALATLEAAMLGPLLGTPRPHPPAGALGLPGGFPEAGIGAAAAPLPWPRATTARGLRLLLSHMADDCGGSFRATAATGSSLVLECQRCGRARHLPVILRGRLHPDDG